MYTYIIVAEAVSIPFRSKAASNQSQQCSAPRRGSGFTVGRVSILLSIRQVLVTHRRLPNIQPESY